MTSSRHMPTGADLTYFGVRCHLAPIVADVSSDNDYNPNLATITATVIFTPRLKAGEVIHAHEASPPTGFLPMPIVAMIDEDGLLKLRSNPDQGAAPLPAIDRLRHRIAVDNKREIETVIDRSTVNYAPVKLLGNSTALELETPLFYDFSFSNVKIDGKATSYTITGGTFEAPWSGDEIIDLLDWMPLPSGPNATGIIRGPEGPPGPPGVDGAPGTPGGPPGPEGPAGSTGPAGPAGPASTVPGPAGPSGPAGPVGPASTVPGPVGPAGPTGPTGADSTVPGPTGQQGIQGAPGLGIRYKGEVATVAELPATGNVGGDLWVIGNRTDDTQPAESYIWDEATLDWVYGGRIQGPQGVPGAASTVPGPTGPAGDPGPAGADSTVPGPAGADGAPGEVGPAGPAGADGVAGADGAPGAAGATGPAGPSAVSANPGNASVLGTDGLVFTPAGGGLVAAPSKTSFPAVGDSTKVYLAEDTGDTFRFDATAKGTDTYVRISESTVSTSIEDSTEVGRDLVTAVDALAARQTIAAAPVGKTVFVQDYRDGVLTDNEILDAAFANLEAGGEIRFEQGVTYTLTATCAPDLTAKPGVVINGQGATLTGAILALFNPTGTRFVGSEPTLTAAITARSKTLTVSSTAAFQPGDLVNIASNGEIYDPDSGTGGATKNEVAEIRAVINSTTIELEGRTWNTYSLTGYTVKLAHYRPMRNVTVKDLTLQSANRTTLETVGLQANYFVALTFNNVKARGFTTSGIYAYGGINVSFLDCHATECSAEIFSTNGANGYGFWVQSTVSSKFIGCYGRRNRHTIDTHNSFDMLFMGCTSENDRSASFSTHSTSTTTIIGCTSRESGGGIVVRGTNNTIIGNKVLGMITTAESGNQSYGSGIIVGLDSGGRGGLCGTNLIIANNFIDITGFTTTVSATTFGTGIWLNSPAINARISGNTIMGCTNPAISVRPILDSDGLEISNNIIDVSNQQGAGLSDGPVNRAAIYLGAKSGAPDMSKVYFRNVNIIDNLVTAGVPQFLVYVRGGSSTGGRGERIRIIGNRSAESCSSNAVYLQEYFGAGVEVWGNEVPASGEVYHNGAFFSSPLIGSPTFRSIDVGSTDTTLTRSAAGVLAVEGIAVPTISSTSTLTNKTLTNPKINTIYDTNGAIALGVGGTASAVNYLTIPNAAAGSSPTLAAWGSDTNVSMNFKPKGAGGFKFLASNNIELVAIAPNTTDPDGMVGRLSIVNSPVSASRPTMTITSHGGGTRNSEINLVTEGTGQLRANGVPVATGETATGGLSLSLWTGTKAQYDAITTKSATTIYVVTTAAATLEGVVEGVTSGVDTGDISSAEPPTVPDSVTDAVGSVQDTLGSVQTGDITAEVKSATTKTTRAKKAT